MIIKLEIEKKLPSNNDSKDWIVFGNNDFIKIEVLNENFNLRGIENDLLNSSSNDASEIIQKFYLYNDYQKDIFEEYLGKAQNSNFLMISFITLNTDNKNIYANYNQEDSFIKKKKELYNNFERSFYENPDIMIFKTVDDYDYIILNYGDSYTDVYSKLESILKSIHKDNDNSYLSIKDNYRMITSNYEKINKYQDIKDDYEIAFSLELKVKNSEDYYSYFYPEIIKILSNWPEQSYYRNGGKDYIYFNSGLSIKTIFSLYAKNGILNQNNKIRNIAIAASNLHFLSTDNQSIYLKTYQNQNISLFTYDTIKEYLNNYTAEQKNAIKTINDSLEFTFKHNLKNYGLVTLYNPINKFYNKLNNLEEKQIIDFDINKSISSFINAAISIIESTTYSQLNYYPQQTFYLGNNLSPIKMITLYLAFLVSIKDIIKTEKKYLESNPTENFGPYQASFSFCLTPVRYQNVEVKVVFEDDNYNDRLLIVQCPIKDFFDPLFMTFSLCHEESHFVGAYIRKRKYRADCIFSLFSNEIILALFNRINYAKYKYYDINKMMDYVGKLIELEKDSFKDKINNSNKGDSSIYYFNEFSKLLINIILNFFNNLSLDSEKFSIIYQDKVENSAIIYQYREEWEKISKQLIINRKKIISDMFIENTMEYTKNIFSETFADQLAVKLLDINNEEYIKIIKGSLSNKKYDDYLDLVYLRCSIIFKVNEWELLNTDDNFINNLNVYNTCYDRYIRGEKISWPSNIFASPFVIKKVVEYLSKCNEAIECAILKDNEDKLKDLRKLKNSDTFLDNFNDLINSFKDRVIFGIYDRNDV